MRLEEAMVWLIWMPARGFIGYLFLTLEAAYGERIGDGMVGGAGRGGAFDTGTKPVRFFWRNRLACLVCRK
jgi:hypothetical protein